MRQFILPPAWSGEKELSLEGRDHHYLSRVLRLKPGDTFPARDTDGVGYSCTVLSVAAEQTSIELKAVADEVTRGGSPRITLVMGVPKGKKMDQVIRQATEAGTERIIPLLSEHSVVRLDRAEGLKKQERWSRVAKEALQQSGTAIPPEILPPANPGDLAQLLSGNDAVLVCHEKARDAASLHELLVRPAVRPAILVGPEGGFSSGELELFSAFHYDSVYLGESVLRAETAAIYAIAAVQTILRESEQWQPQSPDQNG